jgi:PTH1 family peptidyl-tRNA hydrolase
VDPEEQLLVISDDIDLEIGQLRMRKKGSAGGHNGLKNIIQHLGTDAFCRIRIGVGGKPNPDYDLADFVLGHFGKEDREIIEAAEQKAADAAVCMVTDGPDLAMNRYNTPKKKKKKKKAEPVTDAGQESIEKGSMEQEAPGQDTAIISSPENGQ